MLAGLSKPDRAATWDEIGRELAQFEGAGRIRRPCEMLVVSGRKPHVIGPTTDGLVGAAHIQARPEPT
jgi:hypothetical protein